jgi:hypothetical protein
MAHKVEERALPLKAVLGFQREQQAHGGGDFSSLCA